MEPLNRMAVELVDEALDFAEELSVGARELDNGATVLDFGVEHPGGIEAGLLLAEIATAGLATVQTRVDRVAGSPLPHVELTTDHPALALLCSGKAGWELSVDGFEGLASGPARAMVAEEAVFQRVGYAEHAEFAVLAVESETLPTPAVAEAVAERAEVDPEDVFLAVAPAASLAGTVAAAARAAELACVRLFDLGYDPAALRSATGSAPVPPVAGSEAAAVARATDAVAYGGGVSLAVEDEFDELDAVASSAGETYGEPFAAVFEDADWAYDAVEDAAFGPAEVTVDVLGGATHALGERDDALLAESFAL